MVFGGHWRELLGRWRPAFGVVGCAIWAFDRSPLDSAVLPVGDLFSKTIAPVVRIYPLNLLPENQTSTPPSPWERKILWISQWQEAFVSLSLELTCASFRVTCLR